MNTINLALARRGAGKNSTLKASEANYKKTESKAQIVFLVFFAIAILLTLIFDKPTGGWVIPPLLIYCVYYIREYRNISGRHIKKEDIYLSRSVNKSHSALYNLSWTFICFFIFAVIYFFVQIFS